MAELFLRDATVTRASYLFDAMGGPPGIPDSTPGDKVVTVSQDVFDRLNALRREGETDDELVNRAFDFMASHRDSPVHNPEA